MSELRKDYILDRWVIINPHRSKRPHELSPGEVKREGVCNFCPGNEHLTPPESGRIPQNGGWKVRWFDNLYSAVKPEGSPVETIHNRFFTFASAFGHHQVIVETPRHDRQLSDLSEADVADVLHTYARVIANLERKENIKYVSVFKNQGLYGGTSLVHSHSQAIALAKVPPQVEEKLAAMRKFMQCPYCAIVEVERSGARKCFENSEFLAFTPYASRFNYEVWIFPKKHIARLDGVDFNALSKILRRVLRKINNLDYNMLVFYGPKGDDFHFHIEVCPRVAMWAGFELQSGIIINSVSPEEAAAFYRE
ncbi:DUF4931 domain-containing protein [Candidatus Woesearchaeota archaeon]|nr:DUF4931 domain-containing protein [Candidatus Woesearchaeota archaeon]